MSRDADRTNSRSSRNHQYLIKLLGLSSSTSKDDINKFLSSCHIVTIHLLNNNGHSSDQCFVDLESENDVRNALKKNQSTLGNRSIEVNRATIHEYNFYMKHKGMISWQEPIVRMDGLPYTCTMADVQNFFKGVSIARNGIYISRDMTDDACGGGYVAFVTMDNAYRAIDIYNQQNIQHRYIELSPSNYEEAKTKITNDAFLNGKQFAGESIEDERKQDKNGHSRRSRSKQRTRSNSRDRSERRSRPVKRRRSPTPPPPPSSSSPKSPRSRSRPQPKRSREDNHHRRSRSRSSVRQSSPRNGEYLVKMRGMPFNVTEDDIRKFFPSVCKPVRIEILQNHRTKRPNGDGHVYFSTREEVDQAMKRDRKYMGNRYIELYFDSPRHSPSSDNDQHRQSQENSPPIPSRSPSKSKDDFDNTLSRSESEHELLE